MTLAYKISLLAAGVFLLVGMLLGVWKYRKIMTSVEHQAPVYVDIAHRTAFFYSFAALVIAELIKFSPFNENQQTVILMIPLVYFALTIGGYAWHGWRNVTDNQFRERNFVTTWFMYSLITAEICSLLLILGGFVYTQFMQL